MLVPVSHRRCFRVARGWPGQACQLVFKSLCSSARQAEGSHPENEGLAATGALRFREFGSCKRRVLSFGSFREQSNALLKLSRGEGSLSSADACPGRPRLWETEVRGGSPIWVSALPWLPCGDREPAIWAPAPHCSPALFFPRSFSVECACWLVHVQSGTVPRLPDFEAAKALSLEASAWAWLSQSRHRLVPRFPCLRAAESSRSVLLLVACRHLLL